MSTDMFFCGVLVSFFSPRAGGRARSAAGGPSPEPWRKREALRRAPGLPEEVNLGRFFGVFGEFF